jgi:CheY-like chemotaxis protein
MNVLYLEDRGATAYNVECWLNTSGHTALGAYNLQDAQSYWRRRKETPIDCIILDLQVPMDGLTSEQQVEADGGTLAGWVWLRDYVLAEAPEMRQRTIIYSDYIAVLREKVPEEQYRGIKLVSKRQRGNSADVVIASIREIARIARAQQESSKG